MRGVKKKGGGGEEKRGKGRGKKGCFRGLATLPFWPDFAEVCMVAKGLAQKNSPPAGPANHGGGSYTLTLGSHTFDFSPRKHLVTCPATTVECRKQNLSWASKELQY